MALDLSIPCLDRSHLLLYLVTLWKASLSKYYGKVQQSTAKGVGGAGDGMPVLTRVLDLARPAVCALGPLMTHLEVSACWRHLIGTNFTPEYSIIFIIVKRHGSLSAVLCCFFFLGAVFKAETRDDRNRGNSRGCTEDTL